MHRLSQLRQLIPGTHKKLSASDPTVRLTHTSLYCAPGPSKVSIPNPVRPHAPPLIPVSSHNHLSLLTKPHPSLSFQVPTMTETATATKPKQRSNAKRRCLCACIGCGLVVLLLAIVIVILALTLFRVRDPKITLTSTRVAGVAPQVSLPNLSIQLNITLDIVATVNNPNRASFSYDSGQTNLTYRGTQVGQATIEPGRIPNHGSGPVRLSLTVDAAKFADHLGTLIGDVINGTVAFDTYTKIQGRVAILGFIKHHAVASSTCHIEISVSDMKVKSQECDNNTSL